ncbi:DNA glycosylase [Opitutus sp. GAS368]|jgi:N-glycosylase/DNA lyase|uniref:DNA-3-methyladenine glycosylase family protein n=1 Tax=Opitutus sp. GAS368 TaxID=1882749 RepID=UPI000B857DCE|nr:DNA glycosylase [Opitutus sp. GAS368]
MTRIGRQVPWSEWQPLALRLTPDVLAETLDGGQSFRWASVSTPTPVVDMEISDHRVWTGTWAGCVAQLRLRDDSLEWRAPTALRAVVASALPRYLGLDRDWAALIDALPWRSDAHLAQCLAAFPGLRILRQPFGETLLGFLCSATKQIVQIKQMCALLAERHGAEIGRARTPFRAEPAAKGLTALPFHRLPTWAELAAVPEKELRACLLGFRARYIHGTAKFIAARPGWLEETEHLPYPAAKTRLLELPGVGEKVADCVLLFGAGRLEAFPVDTWVLKSLARRYGLEGWKPAPVAHFGRAHFGPLAGLAQQYLFAWERRHGGR